jgi:hypothetical protein
MLPKEHYDEIRGKYWNDVLVPRIPRGQDLLALRKEFDKRTERQPLTSGIGIKLTQAKLAATSALKEMLPSKIMAGMVGGGLPLLGKAEKVLSGKEQEAKKLLEREGASTAIPEVAGAFAGSLPATVAMFSGLEMAAAPLAGNIANVLNLGKKAKLLLNNGLAFSAYDAIHAKQGDKVMAGISGFGEGMAWTLPFLPFLKEAGLAKTTDEAKDLLKKAIQDPQSVPERVHEVIAKKFAEEAKVAGTQELMPSGIVRNPKTKGVNVLMMSKEGQALGVEVKPGRESDALNQIRRLQEKGAEFDSIHFHPDDEARAFKFMREGRDSEAWKYEECTILETRKGMAEQVAKKAREEGVPATALTDEHVELTAKRHEMEKLPHEELATKAEAEQPKPKMSLEKDAELAKRYGADPEKTDLEAIRNTGEVELERLMSIRNRARTAKREFDPTGKGAETSAVSEAVSKLRGALPPSKHFGEPDSIVGAFLTPEGDLLHSGEQEHRAVLEKVGLLPLESPEEYEPLNTSLLDAFQEKEGVARVNFSKAGRYLKQQDRISVTFKSEPTEAQFRVVQKLRETYPRAVIEESLPGVYGYRVFDPNKPPTSAAMTLNDLLKTAPGAEKGLQLRRSKRVDEVKVGDSLSDLLRSKGIGQILTPLMKMSFHPFRTQIEVSPEAMFALNPGAKAITYHKFGEALRELGMRVPQSINEMFPAVFVTKRTAPEEKFHEFLHAAQVKTGFIYDMDKIIPPSSRLHAMSIATKIESGFEGGVYEKSNFRNLLAEAYAYAATAIRYGNTEYGQKWLRQLTEWDGSEEHIKELVKGTSEEMLRLSQGKLDEPSQRILQRKMSDLIRRSDPMISYEIFTSGESARWNPEALNWQIREGSVVHNFKTSEDVWNYALEKDISDVGPNFTSQLELLGIRGPMSAVAPSGGGPPLPTVGLQPEERWIGFSGMSGWFRPFLPWVSTIDSKINKAIRKRGESYPIFDAVKKVDNRLREGDKVLEGWRKGFADVVKGTPEKRLHDYFTVLSYRPKDFGEAAAKYKLSPKDIERVHGVEQWLTKFREDSGIDPFQYLREIYPKLNAYEFAPEAVWSARYDPKSAGRWEKAIREEGFNPKDTHLGRFVSYLMGEGFEKKYTGDALKDLQKLIDRKVGEGGKEQYFLHKGLRAPIDNYIKYVKGIPDQTQSVLNKSFQGFAQHIQKGLQQVNKGLPFGLKIPGSEIDISPRLLQRFVALSYASSLGLRPAIGVRDSLQVLMTTLPVLGGRKFSRGLELMFSKQARSIADEAGAFLGNTNLGAIYGDVLGEIPTGGKVAQRMDELIAKMMLPSRWGHNFARGVTFLGEYDGSLKAIKDLQAGRLSQEAFMKKTSLWFLDEQVSSKFLVEAQKTKNAKGLAKRIALETVDLTQWPYRRGTQPTVLRTGLGRLFGQFGTWPMNYMDFLRRVTSKSMEGGFRGPALRTAGVWFATNYAASAAMESLGADVGKWYFASPAGGSLSMHFDLAKDLYSAPEETDEGRAARKRILTYPLNFIPARVEMESILNVMEDEPEIGTVKGALDPKILRVLGFKPRKEQKDLSPSEWAEYELGFKGARRIP